MKKLSLSQSGAAPFSSHFSAPPSVGYFGGEYLVDVSSYAGLDFSRRCVVFPGQSSAYPGMMKEEVSASKICLDYFARADVLAAELKIPAVSKYVMSPESLSAAEKAQLRNAALFTLEIALYEQLKSKGLRPTVITSHSFGEYAAVVAAGIFRFEDIFKFVVMRDRFSPEAKTTGVMIVVGATTEEAAPALAGIPYEVSNVNSLKQIVISVRPGDEQRALNSLKKARLAGKTLHEMPQPYHTSWMEPTARALEAYLQEQKFKVSRAIVPLISSIGAEYIDADSSGVSSMRLARQVCEPVLFPQQILRCIEAKAVNFIEVGPGDICSQFIKATLGESFFKITPLTRFLGSVEKLKPTRTRSLRSEKSNLLGALSKVIATVTGYSIDEISVEQNFQEDLGIDSIRKAEIVFKFMESMKSEPNSSELLQVNLSQLKRIEDVIEHFESATASGAPKIEETRPHFARFEATWAVEPITDFERLNFNEDAESAFFFVNLETETPDTLNSVTPDSTLVLRLPECARQNGARRDVGRDLGELFSRRLEPWIKEFQKLAVRGSGWPVRIALVVEEGADLYLSGLDGLLRSWVQESGFESYKRLEFAEPLAGASAEKSLRALVADEFLDQRFVDVRYEAGLRFVKQWTPVREPLTASAFPRQPVILALGGSRGIGTVILERFATQFPGAKIILVGRSQETSADAASTLKNLRKFSADVEYRQADVTTDLEQVVDSVVKKHGRIDVVLNGAGRELSRSLKAKSSEEIWEEFSGKVAPALSLADLSQRFSIKQIVNYSSVAAAFGNTGQSIYALGNQIQVGIGERISASAQTVVTNLVLPPWDNLGMTASPVILAGLKAAGVALMPAAEGAKLVVDEICSRKSRSTAFLNANDLRAYDAALTDRAAYVHLFARPIISGAAVRISKLNCKDQPYLKDHVINGNVIYPGSSALALMFYAAYHYFKRVPIIENFEVRSFLAPELELSNCDLLLTQTEPGRVRMQIASRQIVHFVCEAASVLTAEDLQPLSKFSDVSAIEVEPLYGNEHITLGRHFRLASRLSLNDNRELQQVSRNDEMTRYTPTIAFDRLAQWFESALQVMGCQLLWQTKNYWVPNRIGRVVSRFDRRLSNELSYRVEVMKQEKGAALANSRATNSLGEIVFELQNIEDIEVGHDHTDGQFNLKPPVAPGAEMEAHV